MARSRRQDRAPDQAHRRAAPPHRSPRTRMTRPRQSIASPSRSQTQPSSHSVRTPRRVRFARRAAKSSASCSSVSSALGTSVSTDSMWRRVRVSRRPRSGCRRRHAGPQHGSRPVLTIRCRTGSRCREAARRPCPSRVRGSECPPLRLVAGRSRGQPPQAAPGRPELLAAGHDINLSRW